MRAKPSAAVALISGFLVVASVAPARGGSTGASRNVTIALVSERVAVQPGHPFHVAIHMKMRKGWHTYWRNPGDAGLPLRIAWRLPEGFSAGPIEWPAPERIPEGSVMSYGYAREILLPVEITPPSLIAADSATIAGTFDWLECKEVCLPGSSELDLRLPVRAEPPPPGPAASLFAETRSRMPRPPTGLSMSAEAGPRAISLALHVPSGYSTYGAYLYLDQPLVADFAAPQGFERIQNGYRLTMAPAPNAPRPPKRLTGVLVFEECAGVRPRPPITVDVPVSAGDPAPAPVQSEHGRLPMAAVVAIFGLLCLGLALLVRIVLPYVVK